MKTAKDFDIINQGTIVQIRPLNKKAKEWMMSHVESESWQWLGGSLCVDHRYAGDLVLGLHEYGFSL